MVITRAVLQSSELHEKLTSSGAIPILLPLISFAPPDDFEAVDAALLEWKRFDWVIFTSAYGVQSVISRAATLSRDLVGGGSPPSIAVVGPATKEKAEREGFSVHHAARTHLGIALAKELGNLVRGRHVLLPRSDRANPDLPATLQRLGAKVTEVIAYRTVRPSDADQDRLARVAKGEVDAMLFFSPSAVHSFVELAGSEALTHLQNRVAIAAIGPVTAAALREIGVQRVVQAQEATPGAVIAALERYFASAEELKAGVRRA